jgi:hypothetical protein
MRSSGLLQPERQGGKRQQQGKEIDAYASDKVLGK